VSIEKIKLLAGFYRSFALVLFITTLSIVGWVDVNMPTGDLLAWSIVGLCSSVIGVLTLASLFFKIVSKI